MIEEKRPKLGVIIPLANEEETVEKLLTEILQHLLPQDSIYCVFDNACKDSSLALVEKFALNEPRVVAVWAPENRCVVDAYFAGYRHAIANDCQWILEMDGGFSHLPNQIPRFIKAMENGYDFAAGSRYVEGGVTNGRFSRHFISKGGTIATNLLTGTKMKDMTSGFECFNRETLQYVLAKGVKSRAHFFQTEIRHMLHHKNWVEIPITYSDPSKSVGPGVLKD
ncbi:MAG: glycosyltransferase family 2 protein, partial [Candidatus Scalindua sp.]